MLTLRASGWYYDIEDYINENGVTIPPKEGIGSGTNCVSNIDQVELYGGELEASIKLKDYFRASCSYIYKEHSIGDTGFEQGWNYYLPDLVASHKVKLHTRYKLWEKGWFQLSSRFVGERESQDGESMDSYIKANIGFKQQFTYNNQKYMASIYCNNVTGTDYEEIAGYETPEHVWGMSIGMRF